MHFLVDPMVLCLPEPKSEPDQILSFFSYLENWSEFIRGGQGNEFYMTKKCCEVSVQKVPWDLNLIQGLLNDAGGSLDATTTYSSCLRVLENCFGLPLFEDAVDLPELLVYSDTMSLDPDLVKSIPAEIAEALRETFGYVAYAKKIAKHDIASALYFLTHPVNGSDEIEIGVTVEDEKEKKYKVETDLPIVETPEDLLKHKSLTDIWEDTEQAIEWAKGEMNINTGSSHYTVGPGFNQSIENCQFPTHFNRLKQCFEKIARLLSEEQIKDNYALRTGPAGNNPQRTTVVDKKTWSAWRLQITSGRGSVYRLHYWKHQNKYVFSHVVNHNDHNICAIDETIISQIK